MRVKTIVNGKGEPQATEIAIPIEGTGGELGQRAVINLTSLISGLKTMKTEQDIVTHYHIICGFATCCELCGFMTEKSTNDLMHMVEHLVENELARVAVQRCMTDREICRSYHSARHKAQQIQILAELNDIDSLEIIKALVRGGERLPDSTVNKLFKRLDKLEMEIREREREYKTIAAALKGEK